MDEYGRPQFSYWNGDFRTNLYGGKLIENVIQALSACVLKEMMRDINRSLLADTDYYGDEARIGLTVHDEIVAIAKTEVAEPTFTMMTQRMSVNPDWTDNTLVLKAEGGWDSCYSK